MLEILFQGFGRQKVRHRGPEEDGFHPALMHEGLKDDLHKGTIHFVNSHKTIMAAYPTTYTSGPNIKLMRDVTKADFIRACVDISMECQQRGLWDLGWQLEPDTIDEGGMVLRGCPGYKCIRIFYWRWPWIDHHVVKEWRSSADVVYPQSKLYTFLEACRGAPVWTRRELMIVQEVLQKQWRARLTAIPTNKSMCRVL